MKSLWIATTVEQAVDHLKEGIHAGRLAGRLPSERELMEVLGLSRSTIRKVLRRLENDGLISAASRGRGACRRIVESAPLAGPPKALRVAVLLNAPLVEENALNLMMLMEIKLAITQAGHDCVFSSRSQQEFGRDPAKVIQFVNEVAADAWLVHVGSREVLEWFVMHDIPVVAMGGQFSGLPVAAASFNTASTVLVATRHLLDQGHRRIVYIATEISRTSRMKPREQAFLQALREHSLTTGPYNLPDWDETQEGLMTLLESLFSHTPPTAIMLDQPALAMGTLGFLAARGLKVSDDVSLVCLVRSASLDWYRPQLAHFAWDTKKLVRSLVNWVNSVARGAPHQRQKEFAMTFVPGGSISPPAGR